MKHTNQTRVLLLTCCFLACTNWSTAQTGSLPDASRSSEPQPDLLPIPAGTHLLMKLISPLHTTSATAGSGVYLETAFPVVANDRVVIPERTRVLGTVVNERRPGRVKGRAQMQLRFTQLILPDNHELPIVGELQSLPGSNRLRMVDREGTVEPVDQIDADVYTMAKASGVGALFGAISRHGPVGAGYGALIGGGLGLTRVLFSRGDEISLPVGTKVEMVLQRPLTLWAVSTSTRSDPKDSASQQFSTGKQQSASLPTNNVQCLRDGVTFQCVGP